MQRLDELGRLMRIPQKSLAEMGALMAVGLLTFSILAWPLDQPGTMDAHYYYGGGVSLRTSGALEEPYLWNYLIDVDGLPAPSHLYWMPLPSMLVALSQSILGPSFRAAQVPFVLLASLLPLMSYALARALGGERRHAWVAGLLTIFSGFFVPYWSLPETFSPYAVAGSLSLLLVGLSVQDPTGRRSSWLGVGAGVVAGAAHLTRADGVLLLGVGWLCVWLTGWRWPGWATRISALLLAGYLLPMFPWFLRTWHVVGTPIPPAGLKTAFLRTYDELFSAGTPLTWQRYLALGWENILNSKLHAAWTNLQSFVAVNNLIFLTPLSLIGSWHLRRNQVLRPALIYAFGLYGVMTLVFTFPGARGGVFHSSAALLPAIVASSTIGLDRLVDWVARRRPWNRRTAIRFFSAGLVVLAIGLSAYVYSQRVIGDGSWTNPAWNRNDAQMATVGDWIIEADGDKPIVMVGNPPAFHYHTGLSAIAVPNEGIARTVEVAHRYGARYLVLDRNRPAPLAALYDGAQSYPHLELVWNSELGAPTGIVVYLLTVQ